MSTRVEWRPVPGRPYEVSSEGEVRRTGGVTLCVHRDRGGYLRVQLGSGPVARPRKFMVHQLVAMAFLSPAPGPIGRRRGEFQLNHIDGDKSNNRPGNLEWVTPLANHQHAARNGLKCSGVRHHNARLSPNDAAEIRRRAATGESQRDLGTAFGVSHAAIGQLLRGKTWRQEGRAA